MSRNATYTIMPTFLANEDDDCIAIPRHLLESRVLTILNPDEHRLLCYVFLAASYAHKMTVTHNDIVMAGADAGTLAASLSVLEALKLIKHIDADTIHVLVLSGHHADHEHSKFKTRAEAEIVAKAARAGANRQ